MRYWPGEPEFHPKNFLNGSNEYTSDVKESERCVASKHL